MIEQGCPNVIPHDFRQPPRLATDIQRPLREWQERCCRLLPDSIHSLTGVELAWSVLPTTVTRANDFSNSSPLVVFPIILQDPGPTLTLIAFPRPLLLSLILMSLGEPMQQLAADRELSTLEQTVAELLRQQIADTINEVRPASMPSPTSGPWNHQPYLVRLFPGNPEIVVLSFQVHASFGASGCWWLWTASDAEARYGQSARPVERSVHDAARMEAILQQLPMEIVIQLGQATLNVTDLAELEVGDVIVLDQRVSDPVHGLVADQKILRGWPGRVGSRQALQISRVGR
jgi:flagellar motor switch protein FliM